MADSQIGSILGVPAVGAGGTAAKIADIASEGANTFTVAAADVKKFVVGQSVSFRTKATGALVGTRNITIINASGAITYDGADLATTTAEGVYPGAGTTYDVTSGIRTNFNGGPSIDRGFDVGNTDTLADMRARLQAISATTYSDTELNKMTWNDMVYAIRLADAPLSIRQ